MKNYTNMILSIALLFFMALSINAQSIFPILPGSVITDDLNDDETILRDWLDDYDNTPKGTLLYRRSTHGANVTTFHNLVDEKGPTLVLIKASNGQVFGGYTPNSWSSSNPGYKNSSEAFLFNLNTNRKASPSRPQYSIYTQGNYGPTFGGGHDIHINSTMDGGYFWMDSYNNIDGSGNASGNPSALTTLAGINNGNYYYYYFGAGFITEIEVYQIEYNASDPIIQGQDIVVTLDASGNASITAQDIDTGSYDADVPVTLSIDRDTFNCDDVGAGGIPIEPTEIGTKNINNRSLGAAFNPNTEEFWFPEWAGSTVYKTSQDGTQQLGSFNSGQGQMMQMWLDTDSATDYYTANYSYNTITKRSGSSTVWSYNIGNYAAGVSTDADYVYAVTINGNTISVLNKQNGQLLNTISLNANLAIQGSFVVVNEIIYIGGYAYSGTNNNSSWNYIHRFDMQGQYLGSTYTSYPTYYGWAFDGENLWIGNYNNSMLGFKISDGNAYGAGASAVTLTVTDILGNSKSEDFRVTVVDDMVPEITCPGTITVNATNGCAAEVTYNATATDNCSAEITYSIASGSTFEVGTTSVTVTAKDPGGNEVSCTFDVIVVDSEAPVISCLDDITVDVEPDTCGATVSFGTPGSGNIFTSGAFDMQLREIDGTDYSIISQKTIVPSTGSYSRNNGMAKDPSNGDVYVVLSNIRDSNRMLAILDVTTGNASIVGNLGRYFSSLAFSSNGTLYGVTGNGDSPQGGLYTINKTDASSVLLTTIYDGLGQALAFNPDDGYLYHWSDPIMEKIDLSTLSVTNIPVTGYTSQSASCYAWIIGATYNGNGDFIASGRCGNAIINITTGGLVTLINNSSVISNGIVIDGNNFGITATDNCSYTLTQTAGLESGSVFPVGTTVNTFVATDPAGNSTSCSFNVIVVGPEINVSGNAVSIENDDTTPVLEDHTDFGEPLPGEPVVRTFTIENKGTAPLIVSSLTVGGTEASSFTIGDITLPITIAAAETTTFTVTFVATPIAEYNATISINNDDCDEALYNFAIHAEVTCLPVAFTECPTNIEVSNTAGQCGAEVTYSPTIIGDPAPVVTYTFTGATSGSGSGTGSGATFNVGTTTVTINATNACGDENCTFDVTVTDDEAPVIADCPGNISQGNDAGVCAAVVTWTEPTASDNCTNAIDLVWTKSHEPGDTFAEGTTTVTYTATDTAGNVSLECSFDVEVTNTLPSNTVVISAGLDPIQAGTGFSLSADFADDNLTSATWYFSSDGNFTNGDTAEYDQAGTIEGGVVSGDFVFYASQAGVYSVKVEVEDACTETAISITYDYVVIYDPSGGFVTGGGWFYSNPGSMPFNLTAEGKANFGFVAKYKTGKNNVLELGGNTNFQFKEGDFHFKSNVYDEMSLVISGGKKATYRGVGTVNNSGSHKFLVTVIDGDATGGNGIDKFRIKVWGDGPSSDVVYDNELNVVENADSDTDLGGGSIVIHKPLNSSNSSAMKKAEVITELELVTWPNPSNDYFNLKLKSANTVDKININVFDLNGRLVSYKTGEANRDYKIGESLQAGLYFINVVQGDTSKQVKLIKY